MGGLSTARRIIGWYARRQRGVVGRTQLVEAGVSVRTIEGLLRRGELRRVFPSVYDSSPVPIPHGREFAAVLACGPGAALSHWSAAHLYELLPHPAQQAPVHVTAPSVRHRYSGIEAHQCSLLPHERRERHGVTVTSPVRTLIDLAGCAQPEDLESAVAEAIALKLTTAPHLIRALDRYRGRRGVATLRALLDAGPRRTRSTPERQLLRLIRAAGLPEPLTNHRIGPWEVDMYWPDARLVVEVDAYSTHSSPRAFERDRHKSADLADRGLTVHRVTAEVIRRSPEPAVAQVRRRLRSA